jgi:NADPH-dependent ferric siderophore reductase
MTSAQHAARTGQFLATVRSVELLSPRMRRIYLEADQIAGQHWPTGCDIAVVLNGPHGRELRRRYTVRQVSGRALALDAVLHGHGPGSTWAESVSAGDIVTFIGPRGRVDLPVVAGWVALPPDKADAPRVAWRVAFTDESGLPAIGALADALGELPILVYAEIAGDDETYPLPVNATVRWLVRGGEAPGSPDIQLAAVDDAVTRVAALFGVTLGGSEDPVPGFGYVLGESRAIVAIRDALSRLGLDRSAIYAKGYWNLNSRPTR